MTHHERLLASIARQLWPLLGISTPIADALWAWVHFREVRHMLAFGELVHSWCTSRRVSFSRHFGC